MKSLRKSILLLPITALVLMGAAPQKPEKIDTSKWQTFSSKNGDFKIKTPEGWAIADPNDEAFKAGIEKVKKDNPTLLSSITAGADQYDLFLMDFSNVAAGVSKSARAFAAANGVTDTEALDAIENATKAGIKMNGGEEQP